MKISENKFSRILKPSLFALLSLPAIYYAWGVWQDLLGANPLEAVIRGLGDWGLRVLLLTLAISPLRRLFNWPQLLRLRRMVGLYAYFYVVLHLFGYLWFDQFFDWEEIWFDILERPFITVGMVAVILLTPLAVTSTNGMIRRLGKKWKKLHMLIYSISMLGVLHFWWMVKLDITEPVIYAVILAILLGERLFNEFSK
ncbi:sulfoxide reductase heme-binding subunit YedZ [Cocleimonas sp. KMM 6892]|uniref:sulfite oxidase heme-binding subunit YedZ n=1 Tax=unclassified Cocleimonas TaxID=2639732 RepID=UPI002DB8D111|nr:MULTISPECIES: protein-methionine-sulfoxide reductase heme-binding subunit MsrQ [unclassified Cocleimonas]MEB8430705.1 sulfoxide reductase heme-binding subunit YedZ [Cocleimonas sp. KMM 6892]MEC4714523.1 sulfoxide reductase heme-binding subunit YedZ [Cocleimonas sp. KMM 6895]MEC4743856.1 sulfoxide reductase heme-binding subunit YedZ [Cocleimonas sp. KMM 6896]